MKPGDINPPRWVQRLLELYCRPELLEDLAGDLEEHFNRNLQTKGAAKAKLVYWIDVIKFIRLYTIKKPQPKSAMNANMFQNYFKTSVRNLSKNKLFSTINVVGLAISMSVALLLIAFIVELRSFDKQHDNYDRIYRVINTNQYLNDGEEWYASTSIQAGKKIMEEVSGIDAVVILRNGFSNDLKTQGKTLPLEGLWASEGFFDVFSFDVLSGNPGTALTQPHSIVLTESAANKLFDQTDAAGKLVNIDTVTYTITAVIKDPPPNAHFKFEMLGSFATIDNRMINRNDERWLRWNNMWSNYVYLLLPEHAQLDVIQASLDKISSEQNETIASHTKIFMHLQPLSEVVISRDLSNNIGFNYEKKVIWILTALAFIVIVSACFNYTNLSVARALRRSREVGIRKVVGASSRQVFTQFVFEAILIALLSLVFSLGLFTLIKPGFLSLDRSLQSVVRLGLDWDVVLWFIVLAIGVGVMAGFFPALFFAKINSAKVLKDLSSVKLFRNLNMRKVLIVFQYTLSLMFIIAVTIGYKQYKYSLAFDLGFRTENVLNVELQGNKPEAVTTKLRELPEVAGVSKSLMIPSVGTTYSDKIKFTDPLDSTYIYYNVVDENYLALHDHKLIAGRNFTPALAEDAEETEIIVNEETLKRFNIGTPESAIGQELAVGDKKLKIVGVLKDFHYSKVSAPIKSFGFRYSPSGFDYVNIKVSTQDIQGFMTKLDAAWKSVDDVHPIQAQFYDDKIQEAYGELSGMVKIIGFLAFLAISIASLGLLGMVVFTTETRIKEVGIRKALGASDQSLLILLSRNFVWLLAISAALAVPSTYYLFDQVLFAEMAYRATIGWFELFSGIIVVFGIALMAISSQTFKVVRTNPATVLRSE